MTRPPREPQAHAYPPAPPFIAANDASFAAATDKRVLAQGRGWIAIDKPCWMSAHNAPRARDFGSLGLSERGGTAGTKDVLEAAWAARELDAIAFARALLANDSSLARTVGAESGFSPAPAHRLDVGTSGILIVACSREAASLWPALLEASRKVYSAIARGRWRADARPPGLHDANEVCDETEARWRWPLSDKAEGRRDPQGPKAARKPCGTKVRRLGSNRWFVWFEAELETGRTHQIRRHAALAKMPIVGDRRYGDPAHADMIVARYGIDRLALHAGRLRFAPNDVRARLKAPADLLAPEPAEFSRLREAEGELP